MLPIVVGDTVTVALIAGYWAVQPWRMPPEMRPPFRTHRIGLAPGGVYGAILTAMITAAATVLAERLVRRLRRAGHL